MINVPGVPELNGRSYQRHMDAQPVKLGGCGLRSLAEVRHAAFVGDNGTTKPNRIIGK